MKKPWSTQDKRILVDPNADLTTILPKTPWPCSVRAARQIIHEAQARKTTEDCMLAFSMRSRF